MATGSGQHLPAQTFQIGYPLLVGGKRHRFTGRGAAEAAGQQQGHAGDKYQRRRGQQNFSACKAHMNDVQAHHLLLIYIGGWARI